MNTQPWHLYIVTGEVLDKIRKGNTERNVSGVPPSRENITDASSINGSPSSNNSTRTGWLGPPGHTTGGGQAINGSINSKTLNERIIVSP